MATRLEDIDARLQARLDAANANRTGRSSQPRTAAAPRANSPAPQPLPERHAPVAQNASDSVHASFAPIDTISDAVGVEKLEGFSLKKLFSDVFRKHGEDEVEDYFSGGYPSTTPSPGQVSAAWPTPWVFARLLLASVALFILFDFGIAHFRNPNLLPGYMLIGSFAMPLATLVFFLEMNVWRNVSLYQMLRLFLFGGVLSIIVSLFFFDTSFSNWLETSMGASNAGLVEEPGKLLALVLIAGKSKYNRKLNGLLLGAAIGAGFAAFESAGYAFCAFFEGKDALEACRENLILRGVLAPFGHVVWTAIAGAAIWRVKGDGPFRFGMLAKGKFLRLFAVPVVLHMLWNSSWQFPFLLKYVLLGVVGWAVAFALVQEGLREVAEEKSGRECRAVPDVVINGKKQTIGSMALAAFVFIVVTFATGFLIAAGGAFFSRVVLPAISGQ